MKLKLLGNRVLLRKVEPPKISPSGLTLVGDLNSGNSMVYQVLQRGSGVDDSVISGCYVITHSFQGHLAELHDGRIVVDAGEILAVIPNPY